MTLEGNTSAMERHLQSILTLIAVALLLWVGTTTQDATVKIATLEVQVRALQEVHGRPSATTLLLIDQNKEFRIRLMKLEERTR